jgi:hypothetical protein
MNNGTNIAYKSLCTETYVIKLTVKCFLIHVLTSSKANSLKNL